MDTIKPQKSECLGWIWTQRLGMADDKDSHGKCKWIHWYHISSYHKAKFYCVDIVRTSGLKQITSWSGCWRGWPCQSWIQMPPIGTRTTCWPSVPFQSWKGGKGCHVPICYGSMKRSTLTKMTSSVPQRKYRSLESIQDALTAMVSKWVPLLNKHEQVAMEAGELHEVLSSW